MPKLLPAQERAWNRPGCSDDTDALSMHGDYLGLLLCVLKGTDGTQTSISLCGHVVEIVHRRQAPHQFKLYRASFYLVYFLLCDEAILAIF